MFKIGSKVICIDNNNSSLDKDKIYTVIEILYNGNELRLEEMGAGSNFFASRFKIYNISSSWGF